MDINTEIAVREADDLLVTVSSDENVSIQMSLKVPFYQQLLILILL